MDDAMDDAKDGVPVSPERSSKSVLVAAPSGAPAFEPSEEVNYLLASGPAHSVSSANAVAGRLILTHLTLLNFKSYGGRHVVGPFHHKFSCIVGPNGSGKSNVIDALLFVFGRRAQQIRQKRVADLIHKSAAMPECQYAKVTVHFMNICDSLGGGVRQVPGSAFTVGRDVQKDGVSHYYIDDRQTTQKEIAAFLFSRGVDLAHNRFLILQGEIELISQMKPTGRANGEEGLLEYLEDIIGSARFVSCIDDRKQKIAELNAVLWQKRESVEAAQARVDSLKGPAKLTLRYSALERDLLQAKAKLFCKHRLARNRALAEHEERARQKQGEYDTWLADRRKLQAEIATLKADVSKQQDVVKKATKFVAQIDTEFAVFDSKDREITAKEIHCMKRRQQLAKSIQTKEAESQKLTEEAAVIKKKLEEYQEELPRLSVKVEQLTKDLEELEKQLESEFCLLREEKMKADATLLPEMEKLQALEGRDKLLQTQVDLIQAKCEQHSARMLKLEEDFSSCHQQLQLKATAQRELITKHEKQERTALKLTETSKKLSDNLNEERTALMNAQRRVTSLEAEVRDTKTTYSAGPKILSARDSGKLTGLTDRLWNLAEVPPQYHNAVAAVVGWSETLLVESLEAARRVISFVREKQLGRVTCIVQTEIESAGLGKELARLETQQTPESTSYLIDLIKIHRPEKHKLAFFFVLRDTLYCETLEEARKVAFGVGGTGARWRIVTKDGSIVDRSGVMSGGGHLAGSANAHRQAVAHHFSKQSAGNGTAAGNGQAASRQIEDLRVAIRTSEGKIAALKQQQETVSSELQTVQQEILNSKPAEARLAAEISNLEQQLENLKQTLEQQKRLPKSGGDLDDGALRRLLGELKALTPQIALQKEITKVKAEQAERIRSRIESVGGQPRKALREALQTGQAKLNLMREQLKNEGMKPMLNAKQVDNINGELLPDLRRELAAENTVLQSLQKEKADIEEKAGVVLTKKLELEKILTEQTAKAADMEAKLKDRVKETQQAGLEDVRFQTELQALQKEVQGAHDLVNQTSRELGKLEQELSNIPLVADPDIMRSLFDDDEEEEEAEASSGAAGLGKNFQHLKTDYQEEELDSLDELVLQCHIKQLSGALAKSTCESSVLESFKTAVAKLREKTADFNATDEERTYLNSELELVESARLSEFAQGFSQLALNVREFYQMITEDGDAELEVVDSMDPFAAGVNFSVRPPGKSWRPIQNLSGGEKTLSSLALVFALHHLRATPLYFLDEIDAALDYCNVTTIAFYISTATRNAQFTIISLRSNMFELANRLVGIYKTHGISSTATITPDDYVDTDELSSEAAAATQQAQLAADG